MMWSIVLMWQSGCAWIICPELMCIGKRVSAVVHTWLVFIIPLECTTQVLLSKLKIFSWVSLFWKLQLYLIKFALAMKREPMQVLAKLVYRTLQKKVLPRWRQFWRSEEDRVRKAFVQPTAMRLLLLTSGTTEMFDEKLKWMGSDRNLKREILTGKEDKGTKTKLELFKLSVASRSNAAEVKFICRTAVIQVEKMFLGPI